MHIFQIPFRSVIKVLRAFLCRDYYILMDSTHKTKRKEVNIHWWKLPGEVQNIGDSLSPVVVEYFTKKINPTQRKRAYRKHLYAIGSIIDGGYQNAVIWGSGFRRDQKRYWWRRFRKLDIRAVRGHKTREVLLDNGYDCPAVYGDPAVMMPLVYPKNPAVLKEYEYLIIPRHDYRLETERTLSPMVEDWKTFIEELWKAELIISSSLHGIILAESYGIPAVLLNDQDMNLFKYKDYYYSTGRYEFPMARSVEEALTMTPAPLPDLKPLQQALIDSFPKDLWN